MYGMYDELRRPAIPSQSHTAGAYGEHTTGSPQHTQDVYKKQHKQVYHQDLTEQKQVYTQDSSEQVYTPESVQYSVQYDRDLDVHIVDLPSHTYSDSVHTGARIGVHEQGTYPSEGVDVYAGEAEELRVCPELVDGIDSYKNEFVDGVDSYTEQTCAVNEFVDGVDSYTDYVDGVDSYSDQHYGVSLNVYARDDVDTSYNNDVHTTPEGDVLTGDSECQLKQFIIDSLTDESEQLECTHPTEHFPDGHTEYIDIDLVDQLRDTSATHLSQLRDTSATHISHLRDTSHTDKAQVDPLRNGDRLRDTVTDTGEPRPLTTTNVTKHDKIWETLHQPTTTENSRGTVTSGYTQPKVSNKVKNPESLSNGPNVGLMLDQRRTRWTNIQPTLDHHYQHLVFAGAIHLSMFL